MGIFDRAKQVFGIYNAISPALAFWKFYNAISPALASPSGCL